MDKLNWFLTELKKMKVPKDIFWSSLELTLAITFVIIPFPFLLGILPNPGLELSLAMLFVAAFVAPLVCAVYLRKINGGTMLNKLWYLVLIFVSGLNVMLMNMSVDYITTVKMAEIMTITNKALLVAVVFFSIYIAIGTKDADGDNQAFWKKYDLMFGKSVRLTSVKVYSRKRTLLSKKSIGLMSIGLYCRRRNRRLGQSVTLIGGLSLGLYLLLYGNLLIGNPFFYEGVLGQAGFFIYNICVNALGIFSAILLTFGILVITHYKRERTGDPNQDQLAMRFIVASTYTISLIVFYLVAQKAGMVLYVAQTGSFPYLWVTVGVAFLTVILICVRGYYHMNQQTWRPQIT